MAVQRAGLCYHLLTVASSDGSQHFWKCCVYLPNSKVNTWVLPRLSAQINVTEKPYILPTTDSLSASILAKTANTTLQV